MCDELACEAMELQLSLQTILVFKECSTHVVVASMPNLPFMPFLDPALLCGLHNSGPCTHCVLKPHFVRDAGSRNL